MKKTGALLGLLLILSLSPIFPHPSGHTSDFYEETSTDDMIYMRGIVSRVSPEEMQIAVRPLKGKRVVITIDPDTLLEGISQIDELEKKQQVKVWYSIQEETNKAIKIKKMMDLGC